jgi:hypothetical protein
MLLIVTLGSAVTAGVLADVIGPSVFAMNAAGVVAAIEQVTHSTRTTPGYP